jgi:hypothetical protein
MNTYHREYHPESSYRVVQNVLYAQNVVAITPPAPTHGPAPIDLAMAAPYVKLWEHTPNTGGHSHADGGNSSRPSSPTGAAAPRGSVTSPGGLVIYGDVYGDVFLGR